MHAVTKPTNPDDDEYIGPNDADRAALHEPEPPPPHTPTRRNGPPLPRTLNDVHEAANRLHLEPFPRGTKHPEIVFWCPICRQHGKESSASVEKLAGGILSPRCRGCEDAIEPGILAALATNVYPIHPETNGNGTQPTSVRSHVDLLNLDQLLANPPPDPTFAWGNQTGGYLEVGTLCVLHGDGGLGKSLIAQGLCRRYTLGKEWLNQSTQGGIALYLDGENSLAEIARRLYAFEVRPGETNLKYGRVSFPILLEPTRGEELINQLVADTGCTLLVLDSQRALWGGDEREQLEVRPMYDMLARAAERLQIAILLIHHDNKSGVYSGSTDINAAIVSRLHLEKASKNEKKDRRRILWHEKSRSGPESEPVTFTVDKTHDGYLTFQIQDSDTVGAPTGRPRSDMRQRVLGILSDRVHRTRSEVANALAIDHTNTTLRRHWDELINEGEITSQDNQHWGTT